MAQSLPIACWYALFIYSRARMGIKEPPWALYVWDSEAERVAHVGTDPED